MSNHERTVLWVAILASFVAFLDGSIVNVALPAIAKDLGGGIITQQWVFDGYLLTLGSLIMVAGSLSDIFGRVRILRTGLVLFGVASLLCAVAPNGGILISARLLQGASAALLVPSSLALITSSFKEAPRARAIGQWTAWTGTAFVAGPLLGGFLVDAVSWRLVFAINVLPIAATLVLLARLHDPARTESRTPIDFPGAVLAALGLAGTVFALIVQDGPGWGNPVVYLPFAAGLACLGAFIWHQARTPHPMMPLHLFRERNFGIGNLSTAAFYAGISLGTFIIPIFLQEAAAFTAFAAGMATIPLTLMSLALSALFGPLSGKYGPRLFMSAGPVLAGAGFLLMLSVSDPLDYWWQVLPGVVLFGIGLAVTVAPLTAAVLGGVDPAQSGIGSAINNAVSRVAGLLAIAAVGLIAGPVLDTAAFHRVVLVAALLMIAAGIVSAFGISNTKHAESLPVPAEATAACHDRIVPAGTTE
ncbi:MFS transporter [Paeniglutamicibacter antarcticus]|uniref:MFS transporter n=1 Tax=Paeniglutamicibacter antarcticus TaxID=494023 RepID=A0ABP9TL65_9MICC